jgi:hypothetical protein
MEPALRRIDAYMYMHMHMHMHTRTYKKVQTAVIMFTLTREQDDQIGRIFAYRAIYVYVRIIIFFKNLLKYPKF